MAKRPQVSFVKAEKKHSLLRIALFGPAGSGKTLSSLLLAKGIAGDKRFAVLDSENGNSQLYADRMGFDVSVLEDPDVETIIAGLDAAANEGYPVVVIDSLTHAWMALLDMVSYLTETKYAGNSMRSWAEGGPLQKRLIRAILTFPGHVIATMRSKNEWDISKDPVTGKMKPVRVGLTPEQGKEIEYEFNFLMAVAQDHSVTILKDNADCNMQDEVIDLITPEWGAKLLKLAQGTVKAPAKPKETTGGTKSKSTKK